jgi:hypothetical protein
VKRRGNPLRPEFSAHAACGRLPGGRGAGTIPPAALVRLARLLARASAAEFICAQTQTSNSAALIDTDANSGTPNAMEVPGD